MHTTRLVPSDFRIAWFDEQPNDELYGLMPPKGGDEPPSKVGNQPPLGFYSPIRPGPMRLNARANKIRAIVGEESDELALEMGRRLDSLRDQATWGYNWMIPLGMNQTAKSFHDEKSAENGLVAAVDEHNIPADDQNVNNNEIVNGDGDGDLTEMLIENAYSRPTNDTQGSRVFSGASIDESSTYEVGDIAIHEHSDDENEEESEEGERDLDGEMTYHGMLDNQNELSSSDSEEGEFVQGRYLPDNLHSSFHAGGNREDDLPRGDAETNDDDQYFMAREDYQDDHSIIEPSNKLTHPSSRVISGEVGNSRSTRVFPQSSNITTASTAQSINGNQLTGQTSIFDNSSDSDMIIE